MGVFPDARRGGDSAEDDDELPTSSFAYVERMKSTYARSARLHPEGALCRAGVLPPPRPTGRRRHAWRGGRARLARPSVVSQGLARARRSAAVRAAFGRGAVGDRLPAAALAPALERLGVASGAAAAWAASCGFEGTQLLSFDDFDAAQKALRRRARPAIDAKGRVVDERRDSVPDAAAAADAAVAARRRQAASPFSGALQRKAAAAACFDHAGEATSGASHGAAAEADRGAHMRRAACLDLPGDVKERRWTERTLARMELQRYEEARDDVLAWDAEAKQARKEVKRAAKAMEKRRADDGSADDEGSVRAELVPALRPRPMSPVPLARQPPAHARLHAAKLEKAHVADGVGKDQALPAALPARPDDWRTAVTPDGRATRLAGSSGARVERVSSTAPPSVFGPGVRVEFPRRDAAFLAPTDSARASVVSAARDAAKLQKSQRASTRMLSTTLSCNVGLVQRHLQDESVHRARARKQCDSASACAAALVAERSSVDRVRGAALDAAAARRARRNAAMRQLETSVCAARAGVDDEMDDVRRYKTPFAISDRRFTSLIPADPDNQRRRREATLLSEWRAAVHGERDRVDAIRGAQLAAAGAPSPVRGGLGTATSTIDGGGLFVEADAWWAPQPSPQSMAAFYDARDAAREAAIAAELAAAVAASRDDNSRADVRSASLSSARSASSAGSLGAEDRSFKYVD